MTANGRRASQHDEAHPSVRPCPGATQLAWATAFVFAILFYLFFCEIPVHLSYAVSWRLMSSSVSRRLTFT